MWTLDKLQSTGETQVQISGKWVPARPMKALLLWRIRDAWWVLTGKADAFLWPMGQ